MRFLIFNEEKDYDQGTLTDHLNYLRKWGGTPDFYSSAETIQHARKEADNVSFDAIVYDTESEKVFES